MLSPDAETPSQTQTPSTLAVDCAKQNINVKHWCVDATKARDIFPGAVLAIVGSSKTGKTTFLEHLASLSDATISGVPQRVRLWENKYGELEGEGEEEEEETNTLWFFPAACPKKRNKNSFDDIRTLNGMKNGLTVLEEQWWANIMPGVRREIDYVVLTGRHDKKTVERIWEQYEHLFASTLNFQLFSAVIDKCTKNWSRVVIDVSLETRQGVRPAEMFWCGA